MESSLLQESEGRTSMVALACTASERFAVAKALEYALGIGCKVLMFHSPLSPEQDSDSTSFPRTSFCSMMQPIDWMQDAFACLRGPQETELVVSTHAAAANQSAARAVAQAASLPLRMTDIDFDGGDVLALDGQLLVGMNVAYRNGIPMQGPHLDPQRAVWQQLERRLHAAFGLQRVVWVGQTTVFESGCNLPVKNHPQFQPFFHLDLFLMPAGRTPEGHPRLFVGQVPLMDVPREARSRLASLAHALDAIATSLPIHIRDLQIQRLPILVSPGNPTHVRSFCNGWVDALAMGGIAYLPQYDRGNPQVMAAEEMAEQACLRWGLDIRWLDLDFETRSKDGGALHCLVKVIAKQPQ